MPPRSIHFHDSEPSDLGIPRADVIVRGPGGPRGQFFSWAEILVDTGATHSQFPEASLAAIGVDVSRGSSVPISTSNGQTTRTYVLVDLDVQGVPLSGIGMYASPDDVEPLVGRSTLYAAFASVGLTPVEWLWELDAPGGGGSGASVAQTIKLALQMLREVADATQPGTRGRRPPIKVTEDAVWIGDVRLPRRRGRSGNTLG